LESGFGIAPPDGRDQGDPPRGTSGLVRCRRGKSLDVEKFLGATSCDAAAHEVRARVPAGGTGPATAVVRLRGLDRAGTGCEVSVALGGALARVHVGADWREVRLAVDRAAPELDLVVAVEGAPPPPGPWLGLDHVILIPRTW
jgi:hypothetical protein